MQPVSDKDTYHHYAHNRYHSEEHALTAALKRLGEIHAETEPHH